MVLRCGSQGLVGVLGSRGCDGVEGTVAGLELRPRSSLFQASPLRSSMRSLGSTLQRSAMGVGSALTVSLHVGELGSDVMV